MLTLTARHEQALALLHQVEQSAQRAIASSPEQVMPRWNLAVAAAIRGDREAARRWLHEAERGGRRDGLWDAFEPMFDSVRPLAARAWDRPGPDGR